MKYGTWDTPFFLAFTDRVYGPIFSVFEAYQNMMLNIAHYEKVDALFSMENEKILESKTHKNKRIYTVQECLIFISIQ